MVIFARIPEFFAREAMRKTAARRATAYRLN